MRKSLLVVATLFISATAQAGGTRGLSTPHDQQAAKPFRQAEVTVLPAPDEEGSAAQPAIAQPTPVEQVPAVQTKPGVGDAQRAAGEPLPTVKAADTKPAENKPVVAGKVERRTHAKPRKKRMTTEARVRYELGRYGITW